MDGAGGATPFDHHGGLLEPQGPRRYDPMVKDRPGVWPHSSMVEVPSQSSEFRGCLRLAAAAHVGAATRRSRGPPARSGPPRAPSRPERRTLAACMPKSIERLVRQRSPAGPESPISLPLTPSRLGQRSQESPELQGAHAAAASCKGRCQQYCEGQQYCVGSSTAAVLQQFAPAPSQPTS